MSQDMSPSRKPQISVPIGEGTEAELELIAEYLSVSKSSLVQAPYLEWVKSPTYTNLLRRARAELGMREHVDALAQEVGEDNPHIQALRRLLSKND